jgi:hypothetical protein
MHQSSEKQKFNQCRKIQELQKNSENSAKFRKIQKMQKISRISKKFKHNCYVIWACSNRLKLAVRHGFIKKFE